MSTRFEFALTTKRGEDGSHQALALRQPGNAPVLLTYAEAVGILLPTRRESDRRVLFALCRKATPSGRTQALAAVEAGTHAELGVWTYEEAAEIILEATRHLLPALRA